MVGERVSPFLFHLGRLPFYLLAFTVLFPYYWLATSSFRPPSEIVKRPIPLLIQQPTFKNFYNPDYKELTVAPDVDAIGDNAKPVEWRGLLQRINPRNFFGSYLNSFIVTISVTVITILLASMVAYALARNLVPFSEFVFIVLLESMMVPWQVTLIPNYLVVNSLGWLSSELWYAPYLALIVPSLAKAYAVFFFRQAVTSMPGDLFDAAKIDGANEFQIWWSIVLPLLRPAIAAIAIFVSLGEWNNFLWPLLVVQSDAADTVPLTIAKLAGTLATDPLAGGVIMAATLLASIPAVMFFASFQRQFIEGLVGGSLKG